MRDPGIEPGLGVFLVRKQVAIVVRDQRPLELRVPESQGRPACEEGDEAPRDLVCRHEERARG